MAHELAALVAQYGLLVVFFSLVVEQVGVPIPSLPVLVVAGAAAAGGQLPVAGIVIVALVGCLLPDLAWYGAGRRYGRRALGLLCRLSLSPDSCVHRSELRFERWRGRSLLVAKFVPGLSVVAPPLVGALGLRLRSFLALDAAGSLLWIVFAAGLGYVFAGQVNHLLRVIDAAGTVTLYAVLGLLALYLASRWWRRWRAHRTLRATRITVAALHRAMAGADVPLVIDVRSATARRIEPRMIDGAVLVDAEHPQAALHDVAPERAIVSYCDCPNEATSARVAGALQQHGFAHVRPLQGGLHAWERAGYPVRPLTPVAHSPHAGACTAPN